MKIITILGTRPEIIRLSLIIKKLDALVNHIVIHTGQNYDHKLSEVFFHDLGIRKPDYFLGIQAETPFDQIGQILTKTEAIFNKEKPDRILILGDTNSGLTSMIAKRMGIPVFHMEAGNRCYDHRVPEETNRKVIDHSSDILLPYTERSRSNLLAEGIHPHQVYVTGNPILEVIQAFKPQIDSSTILNQLNTSKKNYFLVTIHRAENVDDPNRLLSLVNAFHALVKEYQLPIFVSTHPRTKSRLSGLGSQATENSKLKFLEPFSFFDFVHLEENAFCVLSDSGTVQEECALFGTPNVTLRESTERPETLECGSNFVSGIQSENILRAVKVVLSSKENSWEAPFEYQQKNVSDVVVRLVCSRQLLLGKPY